MRKTDKSADLLANSRHWNIRTPSSPLTDDKEKIDDWIIVKNAPKITLLVPVMWMTTTQSQCFTVSFRLKLSETRSYFAWRNWCCRGSVEVSVRTTNPRIGKYNIIYHLHIVVPKEEEQRRGLFHRPMKIYEQKENEKVLPKQFYAPTESFLLLAFYCYESAFVWILTSRDECRHQWRSLRKKRWSFLGKNTARSSKVFSYNDIVLRLLIVSKSLIQHFPKITCPPQMNNSVAIWPKKSGKSSCNKNIKG